MTALVLFLCVLEEFFISKMYVRADIQLTYNFENIEQKTSN